MTEITLWLYGKPEWEIRNLDEITGEQLKEHGKELMERLNQIGDIVTKLENNEWSKSGGLYDLFFYKDIGFDDAKKELTNLEIDIEKIDLRDDSEDY